MTIRHRAYTFHARKFVQELQECCVVRGRLDLDALHALASDAAASDQGPVPEVLRALRFEPEWLVPSGSPDADPRRWSLMALFGRLQREVPSLTAEGRSSYFVLQQILPEAGWDDNDIRAIVFGQGFASILTDAEDALRDVFFDTRNDSGWLPRERAADLAARLRATVRSWTATPEPPPILQQAARDWGKAVGVLVEDAVHDAIRMLDAARNEDSDLVLVMDQ